MLFAAKTPADLQMQEQRRAQTRASSRRSNNFAGSRSALPVLFLLLLLSAFAPTDAFLFGLLGKKSTEAEAVSTRGQSPPCRAALVWQLK